MKLALLLLAFAQDPTVDALLGQLGDDVLDTREKAASRLVQDWKRWTEADLGKIRKAAEGGDPETASRAGAVWALIDIRRRVPDSVLKEVPDLFNILPRGEPDALADLCDRLEQLMEEGRLDRRDAAPVFIEMLADQRPTKRREESFDDRPSPRQTVQEIAGSGLRAIVRRRNISGREDWRSWWAENGSKAPKEWYLPELSSAYPQFRMEAIRELAQINDPTTHADLLKALASITNGYHILETLGSLAPLPPEVRDPWLKPYLSDGRPFARLGAAQLLFPRFPDDSVGAVLEALETPDAMNLGDIDVEQFRRGEGFVEWLAATSHAKAGAYLCRVLRTGSMLAKLKAIGTFESATFPGLEDALVDAMGDPTICTTSGNAYGASFSSPRLGDIAGMILVQRLKLEGSFDWLGSKRRRDLNLLRIRNAHRAVHGQSPLPLPAGEPETVDPAKVQELLPGLVGDDDEARSRAKERLRRLGPGAWLPLQAKRTEAGPRTATRLDEAIFEVANALRSVDSRGASIAAAADMAKRLHLPLDLALLDRIGDEWFQNDGLESIEAELERDEEGRGIFMTLTMTPTPTGVAGKPTGIGSVSRGSFGAGQATQDVFDRKWKEGFTHPFHEQIGRTAQGCVYLWVRLDKRWK